MNISGQLWICSGLQPPCNKSSKIGLGDLFGNRERDFFFVHSCWVHNRLPELQKYLVMLMFSASSCQRGAGRRKIREGSESPGRCATQQGMVRGAQSSLQLGRVLRRAVWRYQLESGKQHSLLASPGISALSGTAHLGHSWELFDVVPLRGLQCRRPGPGLLEVLLQMFNFFFSLFAKLWESRKEKEADFAHDFYTDILHWKLSCLPNYSTYLLCHSKHFFICHCCVIRQLEREIKRGLRQIR